MSTLQSSIARIRPILQSGARKGHSRLSIGSSRTGHVAFRLERRCVSATAAILHNLNGISHSLESRTKTPEIDRELLKQEHNEDPSTSAETGKPTPSTKTTHFLKGKALDHAIDLRNVRPGDRLDVPYELTVSETLQDLWFTCFFDQS